MSKEYDQYLEDHINAVIQSYYYLVNNDIVEYSEDLENQMTQHDASKRSEEEYDAYDQYFYGINPAQPSYKTDSDFMYAFLHHLHNNPHHWQYWVLIQDSDESHKEEVLDMPYNYAVEMVCDWWSFSWMEYWKTDDKEQLLGVFAWYDDNKDSMKLSDSTRNVVESILERLHENLSQLLR